MFIKNVSESAIIARIMGTKQPIESGETVEMTDEEAENSVSMYPKIFAVVENSVTITDDSTTPTTSENSYDETQNSGNDDEEINLNDMTKPQLKEYAEQMGITLNDKKKKEEMLLDLAVELKKIEEKQTADIL